MVKKTVAVAVSGGVDSTLSAVLLKQQGFNVFAVTMKLWDYSEVGGGDGSSRCCNIELMEGARAVCAKFDIPHHVLNMTRDFKQSVIADFVGEYAQGNTPNPCVVCNTRIKWEALLRKVLSMGADYLATGHYAQVEFYPKAGRWLLKRGLDQKRDQSYFLWGLSQQALSQTLFPLGKLTKKRVRQLATEYGLRTAETPESREICFVTDDDYRRFLNQYASLGPQPGPILDEDGRVVGQHQGIANYTIGQRRGLNLALGYPVYVKRIDPAGNTLHVARADAVTATRFTVKDLNWVSVAPQVDGMECMAKIRYTSKFLPARVKAASDNSGAVTLLEPATAITPGQSAVFYNQDVVLVGGVIREVDYDK